MAGLRSSFHVVAGELRSCRLRLNRKAYSRFYSRFASVLLS